MNDAVLIRSGGESDLEALTDLYNHYIVHTPATFDLEPFSVEQRRAWLHHYADAGRHRLLVAEHTGRVVGFASSSELRPRGAYATSVETTIYLAPDATSRGIGTQLYTALFDALAGEDIHRAYAVITVPNPASIALHRRFGFVETGLQHEVGRKFDRYWSVQWMEKRLP